MGLFNMEKHVMKTATFNTLAKKPLVLSAALIAPFFISAPASANTNTLVNQQAVTQLSTSLKDTVQAYHALERGDATTARATLDKALRTMESAVAKEPTLGVAQTPATALHSDLKSIHSKMRTADKNAVKSELGAVLSRAGITTGA